VSSGVSRPTRGLIPSLARGHGFYVLSSFLTYSLAFEINTMVAAAGIVALYFARMPVPPTMKAPFPLAETAPLADPGV
jgi:hypothetical protein